MTFTADVDGYYYFQLYRNSTAPTWEDSPITYAMLNLGSTASPYSPYKGETIPVQFRTNTINQWDEEWEVGRLNTSTGEPSQATGVRTKNFVPVKPSTSYYCKCPQKIYIIEYAQDKSYLRYYTWRENETYTSNSDAYYIKFYMVDITEYGHNVSINYPSTETSYVPYLTTVYGGYLRINRDGSVDLIGEQAAYVYDGSEDEAWVNRSSDEHHEMTNSQIYLDTDAISSVYPVVTVVGGWNTMETDEIGYTTSSRTVFRIRTKTAMSLAEWKTYLSSNPFKLVAQLATPVIYHLPSISALKSYIGKNNIWSSTNEDTTVAVSEDEVIEQVTPQPLKANDGTNTLSWTAEVSGKEMEVKYKEEVTE
jgi:hypothetical protein